MITEWVPANADSEAIDSAVLLQFAALAELVKDDTEAAKSQIGESQLQQAQGWIRLPESHWQEAIKSLPEKDLFPLARFFTLAEMQFPGWECGASNPAIWLFRYMKAHDLLPEKAEIRALKAMTDNRFIPYGRVL